MVGVQIFLIFEQGQVCQIFFRGWRGCKQGEFRALLWRKKGERKKKRKQKKHTLFYGNYFPAFLGSKQTCTMNKTHTVSLSVVFPLRELPHGVTDDTDLQVPRTCLFLNRAKIKGEKRLVRGKI